MDPPEAVRVALVPVQMFVGPLMVATRLLEIVSVTLAVLEQLPDMTVTE